MHVHSVRKERQRKEEGKESCLNWMATGGNCRAENTAGLKVHRKKSTMQKLCMKLKYAAYFQTSLRFKSCSVTTVPGFLFTVILYGYFISQWN